MPGAYEGRYLLQSANSTGTGIVSGSATKNFGNAGTADAGAWPYNKFYALEVSGNSASASLWAFWDIESPRAILVTAFTAIGPGQTATGQLTGHFPFLVGTVDWTSGGTRTGTVNLWVGGAAGLD